MQKTDSSKETALFTRASSHRKLIKSRVGPKYQNPVP